MALVCQFGLQIVSSILSCVTSGFVDPRVSCPMGYSESGPARCATVIAWPALLGRSIPSLAAGDGRDGSTTSAEPDVNQLRAQIAKSNSIKTTIKPFTNRRIIIFSPHQPPLPPCLDVWNCPAQLDRPLYTDTASPCQPSGRFYLSASREPEVLRFVSS